MVAAYSSTLQVEALEARLALSTAASISPSDDSVVDPAAAVVEASMPPAPTLAVEGMPSVPHQMPTLRAIQSGAWSSASTWEGGVLPGANSVVEIPQGIQVQINTTSAVADELIIHGRVDFATTQNTALHVTTVYVMPMGTLTIGTQAAPIAANVTATITFADRPIDTVLDPTQLGHGLVVHGTLRIHGAELNETFVRLAAEPQAGDTQLQLETPVNWRVGDRIVVPDSRQSLGWETDVANVHGDTAQIAAVTGGGLTIVLAAPLNWGHPGARDAQGVLRFLPHVANLSRNVVLQSENPDGVRGHTMFTERADTDVRYARFFGLGRTKIDTLDNTTFDESGNVTHVGTNQIARYSVHFHHLLGPENASGAYQYVFTGNAIDGGDTVRDFKAAVTIHQSHYGLVSRNVAWNWAGTGIWTEDGNESYNVVEENFVAWVHGTGQRPDSGQTSNDGKRNLAFEGGAIWLRGPNNFVRDNVAAMIWGKAAYMYFHWNAATLQIPSIRGGAPDQTYVPYFDPVLEFSGNEAYAAADRGLEYWWVGVKGASLEGSPADLGRSIFDRLSVWHATWGVFAYESRNVTLQDVTVIGDVTMATHSTVGMNFGDYFQKDPVISGANIQNMRTGFHAGVFADARFASGDSVGITRLESSFLQNYRNIVVGTHYHNGIAAGLPPKRLIVDNVRFEQVAGWDEGQFPGAPQGDIVAVYSAGEDRITNAIQTDEVIVTSYNGQSGNDFRVYYHEQHPDFVVPQSRGDGKGVGSPEQGLTNQENWDKYGIAVAGAIAPTVQTMPRIHGFVSALDGSELPIAPELPVIFGVDDKLVSVAGTFGIELTWVTSRPTTTRVSANGALVYSNDTPDTVHRAMLSGFTAGERVDFQIDATDAIGMSQATHVVRVPSPDSTPPEIKQVRFTAEDVDGRAIINWSTNGDPSTSVIEYGLDTNYGSVVSSNWLETFHALTLENLQPQRTYHFRMQSVDAWGNEAVSGDYTFTTSDGTSDDVRLENGVIWVTGTTGDDVMVVTLGPSPLLALNGVDYSFGSATVTGISIDAGDGTDQLHLTGTAADETANLRFGQLDYTGPEIAVSAGSVESVFLTSGGGNDRANFYDSAANDLYQTSPQWAVMMNPTFYNRVDGFAQTYAFATAGGYDEARMYDSAGNDLYQTWSSLVLMFGAGFFNRADGFEYTRGFATAGGYDEVRMWDTPGNDMYHAWSNRVSHQGATFNNVAEGFELTRGIATSGGWDEARFYDTPGDDRFVAQRNYSTMSGAGYQGRAEGFDVVQAFATSGGYDQATFYDTPGNDLYTTYPGDAIMTAPGAYHHRGHGFDVTMGRATAGGHDEVTMHDSAGNDLYITYPDKVSMSGPGYVNWAGGFEVSRGTATSGGWDEARFYDSPGDDQFVAQRNLSTMSGAGYQGRAEGFDVVQAFATSGGYDQATFYDTPGDDFYVTYATDAIMSAPGAYHHRGHGFDVTIGRATAGGHDEVTMYDSAGDDLYVTYPDKVSMSGSGYVNWAGGFEAARGYATAGGYDEARLYGSTGDDLFVAWQGGAIMSGAGYLSEAEGFEYQRGFGVSGGFDEARLYDSPDNDLLTVRDWGASIDGPALRIQAPYFDRIEAHGINGGLNSSDLAAIDYALELFGQWT